MKPIPQRRGKFQALVRMQQGDTVIFSELKAFDTPGSGVSWSDRLEP